MKSIAAQRITSSSLTEEAGNLYGSRETLNQHNQKSCWKRTISMVVVWMALASSLSSYGVQTFYSFPMDTDPGWTTEGDWAFGQPQGGGSYNQDPLSGHTGANVYGYNLLGDYSNYMPQYWLTTTALDCSGYENITLKFYRWLGVESASFDHAEIEASTNGLDWITIWSHTGGSISDTSWQEMSYNLSMIADGQPTVYIRWGMGPSDGSVTFPGWNIDDVRLEGELLDDLQISALLPLYSEGYETGPFTPNSVNVTLTNTGSAALDWTITESSSWVDVFPAIGTLSATQMSVSVAATINHTAGALPPGTYYADIIFSNLTSGVSQTRVYELEVFPIPGEIYVADTVAPSDDLLVPFGDIIVGLSRTEQIGILNTSTHDLLISDISFGRYVENFDDGLAQNWEEITDAQWEVIGGEYKAEAGIPDVRMQSTYSAETWENCIASAVFGRTGYTGSAAVLILRASDDFSWITETGSAYLIGISGDGHYYVAKYVTGSVSFIQSWTLSPFLNIGTTNHVAVNIEGNSLRVFLNGNEAWSGTDSSIVSAGRVGLLGYSGLSSQTVHTFDDIVVDDPITILSAIGAEQAWLNVHSFKGGLPHTAPVNWAPEPYPGDTEDSTPIRALLDLANGSFSLRNLPTFPHVILPGEHIIFDTVFTPGTIGYTDVATITILSNDNDEPEVSVTLSGTGIPDYLVVEPDEHFFGTGHPGGPFTPSTKDYILHNTSGATVGWLAGAMEPWIEIVPDFGTIPPGTSAVVTVAFHSSAGVLPEGVHANSIVFSNLTTTISHVRPVVLDVFTSPEIIIEPSAGFVVTNRQGEVLKHSMIVSNAISADASLDFTIGTREKGRSEPLTLSLSSLSALAPSHDFTKAAADSEYIPGRIIVRFAQGLQAAGQSAEIAALGGQISERFKLVPGLCVVELDGGMSVEEALRHYNQIPSIVYAQPDYIWQAEMTPNDTDYNLLWGMHNTGQTGGTPDADIDAPEAWDISTGNSSLIVAVIDTGVDYNHVDLDDNMWVNTGEIPGNSIDDDGNGYIDDIYGYDFVNNDGDPMDDHFHGTHCAGTIGAEGNNAQGVAGVCWDVRIMALKFLNSSGSGTTANAISCIEYAMQMGARIMSNSWGGGAYDQALKDVIDAAGAMGIPFVAAAGNDYGANNDAVPHYPSSYESENIIAVISSDHNDTLSGFSNYGLTSTDLAAPGSSIYSCNLGNGYRYSDGTSMATPHVAGACALMLSQNPALSATEIRQILIDTVDPTLPGLCVSGGRLNLVNAVEGAGAPWMSVEPQDASGIVPGDAAEVRVYFDAINTPPGTYTGEVVVACNDLDSPTVTIPAVMIVEPNFLYISPEETLIAEGPLGGPFSPETLEYTLINNSPERIWWRTSDLPSWLELFPSYGPLESGEVLSVEVSFTDAAKSLPVGFYDEVIVFYDTVNEMAHIRNVTLSVLPHVRAVIHNFSMDSDPGWTTEGQWEFGQPLGGGSHDMDPASGYTGTNVYGYNLAGDYANNMSRHWLTTSPLDCTGYTNITLHFQRWLGVEFADFDGAEIQVSNNGFTWYSAWSHSSNSISDSSWQSVSYDISAIADDEPTVYVRWGMGPSDGSVTFPGWNIDDVVLDGGVLPFNIDHFEWSHIAPTQSVGSPIAVTITAKDPYGNTAINFNGSADLSSTNGIDSGILITELEPGTPDAIEFLNVGNSSVDVSGWKIYIYDVDAGWPAPQTVIVIPEGSICQSGDIFTLTEFGTAPGSFPNLYVGRNINWTSGGYGATLLLDAGDQVVDFMCGGIHNPADITQPFTIPTEEWIGPAVSNPGSSQTYQRQGSADNNDASDWTTAAASIGYINIGLVAPFPGTAVVAITPASTGAFTDGVWHGTLRILEAATNIQVMATAGGMYSGSSSLFSAFLSALDLDGDGMLDAWEQDYFGHPSNCVWYIDTDYDGQCNYEEYIAGMDPLDFNSVFRITGITNIGDELIIEWHSVSGRVYHALWTDQLTNGFLYLEMDIPYPFNSWTDTVLNVEESGYYQLEVELE